ncbi:hypothetical protein MIND_01246700 [Mycena indigotica]|uniref:Uncharacterized protein n=1 Tax=Mycena indigotica TaxID=2126181 RepID=A0A8H6VXW1_9AGAR|nr:uncharacterized protein MIND_01246700 [Mycena indigotica]KAF7292194.1 hypothetical protein MIND_01246700 [Mycena indigotica]
MHHCLDIAEIRIAIAAKVKEGDKRDLVSLATSCRIFEAPALETLWDDPGDLTLLYLLRCFPEDALSWPGSRLMMLCTIARPTLQTDWERPLVYAHRVRHFTYTANTVPVETLAVLLLSLPADSLFPHQENDKILEGS